MSDMDKYIKREDAIKAIIENPSKIGVFTAKAIRAIEDLPTADVVEVVRCKDCVYRMELHPMYAYEGRLCKVCFIRNKPVSDNGYCSDAIRKEDK